LILVSKPAIEIECNKDQKSVSARNKKNSWVESVPNVQIKVGN
jgi:hypothetical protein